MRYFYLTILTAIILTAVFLIQTVTVSCAAEEGFTEQELVSGYITITDEADKIILETGHSVEIGDEFISNDNQTYEIVAVSENSAKARTIQKNLTKAPSPWAISAQTAPLTSIKPLIAIYHTHTDECYIPTDGQDVRPGNGSIIRVGNTLADKLRALDYDIVHSIALHDPHDANAYHRSRRTALSLIRKDYPTAMFDVHRDSAPLASYQTVIDGQKTAKILLVVGRQSQNRPIIQNFAQNIKAVADNMHPGLIRGIFIAKGNYNQDLTPRSILLEIGTEHNSLEAAQRGAALLADAIPSALALVNEGAGTNMLKSTPLNAINYSFWDLGVKSGSFASWVLSWKHGIAAVFLVASLGMILYFGFGKFLLRLLKWRN